MDIIKNKNELSTTPLRRDLVDLLEYGVNSVHPATLMRQCMSYNEVYNCVTVQTNEFNLFRGRIFVVGGGKGAGEMALALEGLIGADRVSAGVVTCVRDDYKTEKIHVHKASHPLPDKRGIKGVKEMLDLKKEYNIGQNDLVICLLSGGASSLMPKPAGKVTLKDMQRTTDLLIGSGANIREINSVRKHLSGIKGGQLGRYFDPTTVLSIVISDVIGDRLEVIGSGPTVPDPATFAEALQVLDKYGLLGRIPEEVKLHLEEGAAGQHEETPKKLENCYNYIIGKNSLALENMSLRAKQLGYKPIIAKVDMQGPSEEAARINAARIKAGKYKDYDLILFGGETTPALPDKRGLGGRNQHYALASLLALEGLPGEWAMAAMGTDGVDYTDKAAGALVDRETLKPAAEQGLDPEGHLQGYDSYNFFRQLGRSLIDTGGYTGTNVCDVAVYINPKG